MRLVLVVAAFTLLAVATAVGSGRSVKPVQTTAPVESEGSHMVAFGSSRLLVTHPWFGEDRGSISRVNLDGSLDRSFGEDGTVQIAAADAAVTGDGKILVATTSKPSESATRTEARVTRLLPDGKTDPSFGVNGHADVHFGPRWDYAEALATTPDGDILLAGIMVEYASNYGDEARLAVARLKPNGSLDRSFGKNGVKRLRSWGEIVAFDVAPTPSGGILVEGGNDVETFFWKLKRDGSIDRRFGRAGYREIRGGPKRRGHHEELSLVPGIAVLPGGKLLLVATGFSPGGPGGEYRTVAVRLQPDGRVDRSYGRGGWALAGSSTPAGSMPLPGGDLAVAASFEGKGAKGHSFGAVVFGSDGQIDKRYGQGGRCRARLGGRHGAAGIAVIGGRVIVGGEGTPGPWLLNCPLPNGG
jgi:uncharacterized delta-60 repeat protein